VILSNPALSSAVITSGIKRPEREADHSPPHGIGVKNEVHYAPLKRRRTSKILHVVIS
jgi:hypothetical protein